jgi:hypothetical protein
LQGMKTNLLVSPYLSMFLQLHSPRKLKSNANVLPIKLERLKEISMTCRDQEMFQIFFIRR